MDKYQLLIKSVCLQTGVSFAVGKVIMDNYFRLLKEIISEAREDDPDSFRNVRVPKFGIFYSTEEKRNKEQGRRKHIKNGKISRSKI